MNKAIPAESGIGRHRDALDGVRAVAITLVILFHSLKCACGWIGVQMFFVLSGYLITGILIGDSDLPLGFYLKRFYWRRTLRIFPLYYGYLLVFAIVYAITKTPAVFVRDWPYLLTYTLNFRRILPDFGNNIYYGRFWSLAIEEQFYLVWPLLIYLLPRKRLPALLAIILVAAPILRGITPLLLTPFVHNKEFLYASVDLVTPCQLDSFAVGAALVLFGKRLRVHAVAIFIGSTVLLLACGQMKALITTGKLALNTSFGYDVSMIHAGQYIWGYTVISIWSGALILAASTPNWISKFLALPVMAYIGKISYGMYVYHQIVLLAGYKTFGNFINTQIGFACYFICVVAVSDLSYRFYESRFLALKDTRFKRPESRRGKPAGADLSTAPVLATADEEAVSG
ncbi:MAG: acyltransferase [Terracidiphilus sp.]